MQIHNIPPVYNTDSAVLILGSFPSVKSRAQAFYYAHPQNRFWRMLAAVYHTEKPENVDEKLIFLLERRIALWDVIAQCDVTGSADANIKNAIPNDIASILNAAPIRKILLNGKTAYKYYHTFIGPSVEIPAVCMPSTSPANAGVSFDALVSAWSTELT